LIYNKKKIRPKKFKIIYSAKIEANSIEFAYME
jgi:hypothetical protein